MWILSGLPNTPMQSSTEQEMQFTVHKQKRAKEYKN